MNKCKKNISIMKGILNIKHIASIAAVFCCMLLVTGCDNTSVDDETKYAPEITAFMPANGSAGTEIVITGKHLNDVANAYIGGCPVTLKERVSDERLSVVVNGNAKTGRIVLENVTGKGESENDFIVEHPTPQPDLSRLPDGVNTGERLMIEGAAMNVVNKVVFAASDENNVEAKIISQDINEITLTVPELDSDEAQIKLSFFDGEKETQVDVKKVNILNVSFNYKWEDITVYGQGRDVESLSSFFSPETGIVYANSQWKTALDPVAFKHQAATCSDKNVPAVSEAEYNSVVPYFYFFGSSTGTLQLTSPASTNGQLRNFYVQNKGGDANRITESSGDCYGTPALSFLYLDPKNETHKKLIDELNSGAIKKIDQQSFPIDTENRTCRGISIASMKQSIANTVWADGVFNVGEDKSCDIDAWIMVLYYNVKGQDADNPSLNVKRMGLLHLKHVYFKMYNKGKAPSSSAVTFDALWMKGDYTSTL